MLSTLAAARSGIQAAIRRHANSAYNVANSLTVDFRNVRPIQREAPTGGTAAITVRDSYARQVDLAREATEQIVASTQLAANADVMRTRQEMTGTLLEILA